MEALAPDSRGWAGAPYAFQQPGPELLAPVTPPKRALVGAPGADAPSGEASGASHRENLQEQGAAVELAADTLLGEANARVAAEAVGRFVGVCRTARKPCRRGSALASAPPVWRPTGSCWSG